MNYAEYMDAVVLDAERAIDYMFSDGIVQDQNMDFDDVYDELWIDDAVTGNGSGSYFFNAAKARKCLQDAIFDEDIRRLVKDYSNNFDWNYYLNNPESLDVIIRCLMLGEAYGCLENYFAKQYALHVSEDED